MKKLFYIANIRIPTERAHGIQVMHMCSAFAKRHGSNTGKEHGTGSEQIEVTLLVPDRKTLQEDPFEYYGVERNFAIEKISVPDTVRLGKLGFLFESIVFAWRAGKKVKISLPPPRLADLPAPSTARQAGSAPLLRQEGRKTKDEVVVYTREELPLLFVPSGIKTFYEAHNLRNSLFFRLLIKQATGIVAISQGIANAILALPFPRQHVFVAHDGYDEKQFNISVSKEESRTRLGLPHGVPIAMYTGGLEGWKGSGTLLDASEALYQDGIRVAIIGGSEQELSLLRARYPHVLFLGSTPYRDLAYNQKSADVLVIPNSAKERISREFTSPLKLFTYMASARPIVSSDLPSLREVLTEDEAVFFKPDDAEDMVPAIKKILADKARADTLSRNACEKAKEFTWDKRAEKIVSFFG